MKGRLRLPLSKHLHLTDAGISAESGVATFRGPDGLFEGHGVEESKPIPGNVRFRAIEDIDRGDALGSSMHMPVEPISREPALIVMGSARPFGNTRRAVDRLSEGLVDRGTLVDLSSKTIEPFAYGLPPDRDQFLSVVHQMTAHQRIVFATPVYWYAMSGLMKTLFDRLTDLLTSETDRPLGRSLAGRNVWLLATGTDEELPRGFEEPFVRTAAYFDMVWKGVFYVRSIKGAPPAEPQLRQVDKLLRCLI